MLGMGALSQDINAMILTGFLCLLFTSFTKGLGQFTSLSVSHKVHKNNHPIKRASLIRSSSYVSLDVESDSYSSVNDTSSIHFSHTQKTLTSVLKEKDLESLLNLGGVKHIASNLCIDDTLGLSSIDTHGLMLRKAFYGSNVYQRPSKRTFISFNIEAFKDSLGLSLYL